MVLDLFAEGLDAAFDACSLTVVVLGIFIATANGPKRIYALTSFYLSMTFVSWMRFAERGGGWDHRIISICLLIAAIISIKPKEDPAIRATIAGILTGITAAEIWRPCVGADFGDLLNSIVERGVSGLLLLAIYTLGILLPIGAYISIFYLVPYKRLKNIEPYLIYISIAFITISAIGIFFDQHHLIIDQFYKWTNS